MSETTHPTPAPSTQGRLLADVGGTHARLAWQAGADAPIEHVQVLPVAAHASLRDAIRVYLAGIGRQPREAAIAMANPVTGDLVRMTNHHWSFSQAELKADWAEAIAASAENTRTWPTAFRMRVMNTQPSRKPMPYIHAIDSQPSHHASGTLATTRWLVALLETHQRADGSVVVPEPLRPYLRGLEILEPVA